MEAITFTESNKEIDNKLREYYKITQDEKHDALSEQNEVKK